MLFSVNEISRISIITYKERDIEATAVEVQVLYHALDFRIADVDAIQERHHVDDEKRWVDKKVELPDQLLLRDRVNGKLVRSARLRRGGDHRLLCLHRHLLVILRGHDEIQSLKTRGRVSGSSKRREKQECVLRYTE